MTDNEEPRFFGELEQFDPYWLENLRNSYEDYLDNSDDEPDDIADFLHVDRECEYCHGTGVYWDGPGCRYCDDMGYKWWL